ncbi:MAG: hypothetical protein R3325_00710 [Thermoanaerobaculia bacterium]|nr:hypothetical protein [Thermoanaerobaculia bacterium]
MTPLDESRSPTLAQLAWTFGPFGILTLAVVLGAIALPNANVTYNRAVGWIWVSIVFAAPALVIWTVGAYRRPLSNLWRLSWTFSAVAYLLHFWITQFRIYQGDVGAVFANQGTVVALSNYLVTVVWTLDVVLAWATRRPDGWIGWVRTASHLLVFVSIVTSSVAFRPVFSPVWLLGLATAIAVVGAALVRWLGRPAPA